jgi:PEP-CTERM/exosortase A-associated glycosyltransferase
MDGYAVRSANIIRYQRELKIEPVALTSPAHPNGFCDVETIDETRHYRTLGDRIPSIPFVHQYWAIGRMSSRIDDVVKREQPDILHAHSPSLWGTAAARVAKRRKLPFIYEIRGYWEDAAVDQGKTRPRSMRYQLSRIMEAHVARVANRVIAIGSRLKEDLVDRGIDQSKIDIVSNGVDRKRFYPRAPDCGLEADLGLKDRPRIGYIGTLYPWEGVDDLVRAVPKIRSRIPNVFVLIVGSGLLDDTLRKLIDQLNISDCVRLVGNVPHNDICRYYSIMDILAYPRKSSRNTELVTPLKPLEAMAMEKAVVGSDVGGIRELITSESGVLFRAGDADELAQKCIDLLSNTERRRLLGAAACKYVTAHKDWRLIASTYNDVYDRALNNNTTMQVSAEPSISANQPVASIAAPKSRGFE